MPVTLRQIVDRVLTDGGYPRRETSAPDAELSFKLKQYINEAYRDIQRRRRWTWLEALLEMSTSAAITSGTASVTEDSRTVVLSTTVGATNYAKMRGRFLVVDGQPYRIQSASSGTILILDTEYRGDTDTAAAFAIYQVEYVLPWDVDTIKSVRDFGDSEPIRPYKSDPLDLYANVQAGIPDWYYFSGHTWKYAYATGTLSATADPVAETSAFTGSGTAWSTDGRCEVGDTMLVWGLSGGAGGTDQRVAYPYRIRSIASATTITAEPGAKETYAAGTYYEIKPKNSGMLLFYNWPTSKRRYQIKYERRLPPLVADTDRPEMPDEFHDCIAPRALAKWKKDNGLLDEAKAANDVYYEMIGELEWDDPTDQQREEYPEITVTEF
jgi:hypothetical protein